MSSFSPPRISLQSCAHWLLFCFVLLAVLYPAGLIIVDSFRAPGEKFPGGFGLHAWKLAFADPALMTAIWNTVAITIARQAIALPIAVMLAWIIARTDVPAAKTLEFLFWLGYFLPPLPVTMGWILLLEPDYGLLNQWVTQWTFIRQPPFNIYSFWGIVWAHLTTSTIAVEVMLLTPAFRNMDATLEEASLASGASILRTLGSIVVPLMTPIVGVVLLLGIVHSLQAFELELILGFPFRFYVFSTQIHWLLHQQPPQFAAATALGSTILFIMTPFVILQRRLAAGRNFATLGSRYQGRPHRLGKWRWIVCAILLTVALSITLVPFGFLVAASLMARFGYFNIPYPWTLVHWSRVFDDSVFLQSFKNPLVLAGATALLAVALFTLIAFMIMRTRFVGRAALDIVSWLPSTLPGIILGLALL